MALLVRTKGKVRRTVPVILGILSLCLTSCGNSADYRSTDGMVSNSFEGAYSPSFSTGGDYANTDITGDKVDYSYTFTAGGKTFKTKEQMLSDYELIQDAINEKGGYIASVDNNYSSYDMDSDARYGNGMDYKAEGMIRFTAEVDNAYIPDIVSLLEQICVDNRFSVNTYRQQITNYRAYTVTDETEDWKETITEEELNRRLQYAELSVSISYRVPRAWPVRAFIGFRENIRDLCDSAGRIVIFFLAYTFGLVILFIQVAFFYKAFVKVRYQHRQKHPEYYEGIRHVMVHEPRQKE